MQLNVHIVMGVEKILMIINPAKYVKVLDTQNLEFSSNYHLVSSRIGSPFCPKFLYFFSKYGLFRVVNIHSIWT